MRNEASLLKRFQNNRFLVRYTAVSFWFGEAKLLPLAGIHFANGSRLDQEFSFEHTLHQEALKVFNEKDPAKRSSWHLNDREKLKQLAESAGFVNVLIWQHFVPGKHESPEDIRKRVTNVVSVRWPNKETLGQVIDYVCRREEEVKSQLNRPIGLSCIVLYGEKPAN